MVDLILKTALVWCSLTAFGAPSESPKAFEVSLFTGISSLVKLGDTYPGVTKRIPYPFEKLPENEDLKALRLTQAIYYRDLGLRVYFRRTGAVLITLQEPFKGTLRTKKIPLFPFGPAPQGTWEEVLVKELGPPDFVVSGGRLNSKALFYSWGDISFNAMGPNQLALYRDPSVIKFREKNFGREVQVMPGPQSQSETSKD